MPKIRNTHPAGYIDVPLLGRQAGTEGAPYYVCPDGDMCVERNGFDHEHTQFVNNNGAGDPGVGALIPGEEVEVTEDQAAVLLAQVGNFAPVGDALDVMTVDELKALAEENGVDLTGLTKKADIAAAIKKG